MNGLLFKFWHIYVAITTGWHTLLFLGPMLGIAAYYGLLISERRLSSQRAALWKFDPLIVVCISLALAVGVHKFAWPVIDRWSLAQWIIVGTAGRAMLLLFYIKMIGAYGGSLCLPGLLAGAFVAAGRIGGSKPIEKDKEIVTGTVIVDGAPIQKAAALKLKKVRKAIHA